MEVYNQQSGKAATITAGKYFLCMVFVMSVLQTMYQDFCSLDLVCICILCVSHYFHGGVFTYQFEEP